MAIVGCSNDATDKNAEFASQQGFEYPLLCDTDLKVAVAYGAAADSTASAARRIATLIDENGLVQKYYDPAGKGEFPAKVLSEL